MSVTSTALKLMAAAATAGVTLAAQAQWGYGQRQQQPTGPEPGVCAPNAMLGEHTFMNPRPGTEDFYNGWRVVPGQKVYLQGASPTKVCPMTINPPTVTAVTRIYSQLAVNDLKACASQAGPYAALFSECQIPDPPKKLWAWNGGAMNTDAMQMLGIPYVCTVSSISPIEIRAPRSGEPNYLVTGRCEPRDPRFTSGQLRYEIVRNNHYHNMMKPGGW